MIHALTDELCRPIPCILTGGQMADCTTGAQLLEVPSPCRTLHEGYDTNAIRRRGNRRRLALAGCSAWQKFVARRS